MEKEKAQTDLCPSCGAPSYAGHTPECPANLTKQDAENNKTGLEQPVEASESANPDDSAIPEGEMQSPVPTDQETPTETGEDAKKSQEKIDQEVQEAIRIKSEADELTETARGLIKSLGGIKSKLDHRDNTDRALDPLLENAITSFRGQILELDEKSQGLLAGQKNNQRELNQFPQDAQDILKKADYLMEESVAEIMRIQKGLAETLERNSREAQRILRATENYLTHSVDPESNIAQAVLSLRRMQQEVEAKRIRPKVS